MDKDNKDEVRKWKAMAIVLAIVALLAIGLPYVQEDSPDDQIMLNNETHEVKKIASVDIEPGHVSPVKKNT